VAGRPRPADVYDPLVAADPIVSYAPNREDVVLWRGLQGATPGRYVEIGAGHPVRGSVTRALYDHGWAGLTVDADEDCVLLHRSERPRDTQVHAAVVAEPATTVELPPRTTAPDAPAGAARTAPGRTLDRVLDEHGWRDEPTHVLVLAVTGGTAGVLAGVDLSAWRPWVVVADARGADGSPDDGWIDALSDAGYVPCLFDGVSRYFVAEEHEDLGDALSYPACSLDRFVDATHRALEAELAQAREELRRWRAEALEQWSSAGTPGADPATAEALAAARAEVAALRASTSWRVTAPLRAISSLLGRR